MSKYTLETVNEVENRLDAIKEAVAELQSAISGLDNMGLANRFNLEDWAVELDTYVVNLQADLEEVTGVELSEY